MPLKAVPKQRKPAVESSAPNGEEAQFEQRPQRRTFILLLVVTCVVMLGIAFLLWWVPYIGLTNIHPDLPLILAIVLGGFVLFGLGGALTLVFTIIRGKNLFFNRRIRGVTIRVLFPVIVAIGKVFGVSKNSIRRSFIAINNQLVMAEARKVKPDKLLLLLPHCLQFHECDVRITSVSGNVDNCKRCGRCRIKDLVEVADKYHISIRVATGGTLARKVVKETKPDMIVAVACERDLTSGIQDTYPLPVFGIFNRRPYGPCYDTDVDMELVKQGLNAFLLESQKGEPPLRAR